MSVQAILKAGDEALFRRAAVIRQYKSERIKSPHFFLEDMAEILAGYMHAIILCPQLGYHVALPDPLSQSERAKAIGRWYGSISLIVEGFGLEAASDL